MLPRVEDGGRQRLKGEHEKEGAVISCRYVTTEYNVLRRGPIDIQILHAKTTSAAANIC